MSLLQTILLSFFLMCLFAVPTAIFVKEIKGKFKKPAVSSRKFKRREKFHKHGQEQFKHEDENENDKS